MHHPLALQVLEDPREHAVLRPPVHPGVNGVPLAEARRQSAPLAAVLDDIEEGIEHLEVGRGDIAALDRQMRGNAFVLDLAEFHTDDSLTRDQPT